VTPTEQQYVPDNAPGCYRQMLTGAAVPVRGDTQRRWVRAADVFESFPVGFLEML